MTSDSPAFYSRLEASWNFFVRCKDELKLIAAFYIAQFGSLLLQVPFQIK